MVRQRIPPSGLFYTNNIGRMFLQGAEGLIGKEALADLLRNWELEGYIDNYPPANFDRAIDFADIATLSAGLDELGASKGDPSLNLRLGKATFKGGLRAFGGMASTGVVSMGFQTVSANSRVKMGLLLMAAVFSTFTDQQTEVKDHSDHFDYMVKRCPLCQGRHADHPICSAAIGLLQEGLQWAADREFRVEETTCRAKGDEACTFVIYKGSNG